MIHHLFLLIVICFCLQGCGRGPGSQQETDPYLRAHPLQRKTINIEGTIEKEDNWSDTFYYTEDDYYDWIYGGG